MNNGRAHASHFDLKALLFMHFGNHIRNCSCVLGIIQSSQSQSLARHFK